jgi:hypothetical protein
MRKISKIIVHWSASHSTTTVEDIRLWHKQKGWKDIGYHRVVLHPDSVKSKPVKPGDLLKKGRPMNDDSYLEDWERGAHTLNQNSDSVGICVIGDKKYPLHPLQAIALQQALELLIERFKLKRSDVYCHRDFGGSECPGLEIYALVKGWKKGTLA